MPNAPQTHRHRGYTTREEREKTWASRVQGHPEWYRRAPWTGEAGLRMQALNRDCWLCQECKRNGLLTPLNKGDGSAHVDHIKPHQWNRELFYDLDNLQSLCVSCHSTKTASEDGGFGMQRRTKGQG